MSVYYNEFDPKAAAWLRELIKQGHLPAGTVDTRSIVDVKAEDLRGYTQCHFFAGIGGWPLALAMAGWPADKAVWTGSCPCQPFSQANSRRKAVDERDLWPVFGSLIRECEAPVVFGEQVASPLGLAWLDSVYADMESAGYAVGASDLCAAGVGAPHIRQRLYWVAVGNASRSRGRRYGGAILGTETEAERRMWDFSHLTLAASDAGQLGDADSARSQGRSEQRYSAHELSPWTAGVAYVDCIDGKMRPIEPGSFPLAHGVPGRVGLLRGYGNAIVPQLAATFIQAVMEST